MIKEGIAKIGNWIKNISSNDEDKFLSWEEYKKIIEEKDEEVIKNGKYYTGFCIFIIAAIFNSN